MVLMKIMFCPQLVKILTLTYVLREWVITCIRLEILQYNITFITKKIGATKV